MRAKLDYLEESRPRIVSRSTVERVLLDRFAPPQPGSDGPACPRCDSANGRGAAFCRICAVRLAADRTDFEGSLAEIAELNHHHREFAEGMKGCQEVIGLVRGLGSGLQAFRKSVKGVQDSEKRYPLPKLKIDVPAASLAFGKRFDALRDVARRDRAVHPRAFAGELATVTRAMTPEAVQAYFETMGQELTRCANTQWK